MKQKLLWKIVSVVFMVVVIIIASAAPPVQANTESISNAQVLAAPSLDLEDDFNIVYYVDNTVTCADTGPGSGTVSLPFCHITRGAALAHSGDLVYVMNGTYPETVWVDTNSGVAGSPITIMANPSAVPQVTITGETGNTTSGAGFYIAQRSYISIEGFKIDGTPFKGIYAVESDHINLTDNIITDAGQHVYGEHQQGIHFRTVTNSVIDGNVTYYNSCVGIRLTNSSNNNLISNNLSYSNFSDNPVTPSTITDAAGIELVDSDNNLVLHNIVYDNEDTGINMYIGNGNGANGNLIIGNLVYGNRDHGIDNNSSSGQIIIGNTVHGNHTSGINLELNSGGAVLQNNIVSDNGVAPEEGRKAYNIYVDSTSVGGTTLDYNLYHITPPTVTQIKWGVTGYSSLAAFKTANPAQEAHGLEGNPHFISPAALATLLHGSTGGDYHLLAPSPAIDSANSAAPSQPDTDLDGNPRLDDLSVVNTGAGPRLYDDRGAYEWQTGLLTNLATSPITNTYGQTVTLNATLSRASDGTKLNNKTVNFSLNGVAACSDATDSNGLASCTASLLVDVGAYPAGVNAIFSGDVDYAPSSDSAQLTVNARDLTVTATGVNKIYDGTTAATVTLSDDRIPGDIFTDSYTAAIFTGNENVGTAKPVSVSGISISGTDAGNYNLLNVTAATNANITVRDLTVTATGVNKDYDGNTGATVTLSDNRILNDVLTTAYTGASFDNENVGTAKTVNVSGIAISGTDAVNYNLLNTTTTTTANIVALHITGSFTAANKIYDSNTSAVVLSRLVNGIIAGDAVQLIGGTASFATKTVGTGKIVTLTGAVLDGLDKNNYILDAVTVTSANITARDLTVTATGVNKEYDGTADATVTLSDNRVLNDVLTATYTLASFDDETIGTGKTVSASGIAISGTDAANYYLLNTTDTTTADITAKHITGSFTADDKVYDGNTDAIVLSRSVNDLIEGDSVQLIGGTAAFLSKIVGTGKPVTLTGAILDGLDKDNYILDSVADTVANITARDLTVNAVGVNKVYDGTADATVTFTDDRVLNDILTINYDAVFADANVNTGIAVSVTSIAISGPDSGNYQLLNTTGETTADITPKPITVTADSGLSKWFATTDPVFTYIYSPNDPPVVFSGLLSREPGEAVGEYAITQGTLSAGDNYSISFSSALFTINGFQLFMPLVLR